MPGFFHETTSAIRTVNHNFHLKKTPCVKENCPWSVEAVIVLQTLILMEKRCLGSQKRVIIRTLPKICSGLKINSIIYDGFPFCWSQRTSTQHGREVYSLCCIASLFIICQESNKRWLQVASPCMCSNCLMNESVVSAVCVGVGLCGSHLHKWLMQSNRLAAVPPSRRNPKEKHVWFCRSARTCPFITPV